MKQHQVENILTARRDSPPANYHRPCIQDDYFNISKILEMGFRERKALGFNFENYRKNNFEFSTSIST